MTTNYHTAIATGAPANASTFETPLASLDAELTAQDGRLDVLEGLEINYSGHPDEYLNGGGAFTVPAGTGSTNGHTIQFDGVDQTQRGALNFTGDGVNVLDGASGTKVDFGMRADGFGTNYQLQSSIAASVYLDIVIKGADGNDPSADNPVMVRIGNSLVKLTAAKLLEIAPAFGDIFGWDAGKVQANDAQLFIYAIDNNGTFELGASPCPSLTTVATNYWDIGAAAQTGSKVFTNIVMTGTRNANNLCRVIGRINVKQLDNNNWATPTIAKVVNAPIWETDWLTWTPAHSRSGGAYSNLPTQSTAKYRINRNILHWEEVHTQNATPGSSGRQIFTAPVLSVSGNQGMGINANSLNVVFSFIGSAAQTIGLWKYDGTSECTPSQTYSSSGFYEIAGA